jgi:hypothetical protein
MRCWHEKEVRGRDAVLKPSPDYEAAGSLAILLHQVIEGRLDDVVLVEVGFIDARSSCLKCLK